MYKLVTKFMNGTKTEHTAAMYSIAMMYASNVSRSDDVLSVTIYNSSGDKCTILQNGIEARDTGREGGEE